VFNIQLHLSAPQAVTEKRASRSATAAQKELDRELAMREAERNIASVQLDRVRMQMAECTRPLQYTVVSVSFSLDALGEKLESAWGRPVFGQRRTTFSPPEEQHVTFTLAHYFFTHGGSKLKQPVAYKLDPEGIARLDVEPVSRAHWVETWLAVEPLLDRIENIILTKPHLNEPVKLSGLEKFYDLGRSWEERFGSAGTIFTLVEVWTRQW
jgi:hypothetical protein